jgi:hypothetical protein
MGHFLARELLSGLLYVVEDVQTVGRAPRMQPGKRGRRKERDMM